MESRLLRGLTVLGVPGVAIGVFYLLLRNFNFHFDSIPPIWAATIAILFLVVVGVVTLYALNRWAPSRADSGHSTEAEHLARLQREQIEAAAHFPSIAVNIFRVTIHYSDGDLEDVAVELVFENNSALNRSIIDCSVGLLDTPTDGSLSIACQAEYKDKLAEYPITIPSHSSLILYSFQRRLEPIYKSQYGINATIEKHVGVRVRMAGITKPLVRVVGRYSPTRGLITI